MAAFGGIEGIWDPAVPVLQMGRRGSEMPSHLSRGTQLLSDRVKIPIQCIQKQNLFIYFFPLAEKEKPKASITKMTFGII